MPDGRRSVMIEESTPLLKQIGKRLANTRKSLGYTQDELGNLAGLYSKMISAAENGHKAMRPESILKISEALDITTDYLLKGTSSSFDSLIESKKINELTDQQKEALIQIINGFLSVCY